VIDYLMIYFLAPISAAYDRVQSLPAVRQPALLLSARTDTLAVHVSACVSSCLRQHGIVSFWIIGCTIRRAIEYTKVLANFLDGTRAKPGAV